MFLFACGEYSGRLSIIDRHRNANQRQPTNYTHLERTTFVWYTGCYKCFVVVHAGCYYLANTLYRGFESPNTDSGKETAVSCDRLTTREISARLAAILEEFEGSTPVRCGRASIHTVDWFSRVRTARHRSSPIPCGPLGYKSLACRER